MFAWTELFLQTMVSLLSVLIFSRITVSKQFSSTLKFKRKKKTIILGNGPSLHTILDKSLETLLSEDADLLAVNFFCLSTYFHRVKPSSYIFIDPTLYKTSKGEIEERKAKMVECFQKINWDMLFFVPYSAKNSSLLKAISKNHFIKIVYLNIVPVKAFWRIERFLFKHNLGLPFPMNVLNAAIYVMINMKYQNIYLLGADHSWLNSFYINENNDLIMGDRHFDGANDFKHPSTLSKWLKTQVITFESHEKLQQYAVSCDVNIYNATKGSLIDAYPRKYLFE